MDNKQEEIELMSRVQEVSQFVDALVDELAAHPTTDKRWVSIAVTQLQQGGMALRRSITKPDSLF